MSRKLDPEEARQEMIRLGVEPSEPYPGNVDAPWPGGIAMECGHPVSVSLSNARNPRQGPCKLCGLAKLSEIFRLPLNVVVADLAAKGMRVVGNYVNNRTPIECVCTVCGEPSDTVTYSNAMRVGIGACNGTCKRVKIGNSNRLDAAKAEALALANNLIPQALYTGADDHWPLKCAICGNIGEKTSYSVIKQNKHTCMPCGRIRTADARRLPEIEAARSMLAASLRPDVPYPGHVNTSWACTCMVCGTRLRPGPWLSGVRTQEKAGKRSGCTTCSDTSFKPNQQGWIYLVVNHTARYLKWGIANDLDNRLREHKRQAFDVEEGRWFFDLGRDAQTVEKAAGRLVRAAGATTVIAQELMPYKGYSETASLDEISVKEVITIIEGQLELLVGGTARL